MKKLILICFLLVAGWIFYSSQSARAMGISIKPKSLFIVAKEGETIEREILATNISDEALIYKVYLDSNNKEVSFLPDNFRLESGEHKLVKVKLKAKHVGTVKTRISVLAKPLSGQDFSILSGVKINLTYQILPDALLEQKRLLILVTTLTSFLLLVSSLTLIKK